MSNTLDTRGEVIQLRNGLMSEFAGHNLGQAGTSRIMGDVTDHLLDEQKLSVKQGAAKMGIGQTSLRRIIKQGELPVLKIGGKVLLVARDIEAYLADCHVVLHEQEATRSRRLAEPEWVTKSEHFG